MSVVYQTRPGQSIAERTARAAQRAREARSEYTLTWITSVVTEKGSGRSLTFRICTVEKAGGSRYEVTYAPTGTTSCTCPQGHLNRGTLGACKHVHLCDLDRAEREQEREPACPSCHGSGTVTDWVDYGSTQVPLESECDCAAEPAPTPAADAFRQRHAQALRDRTRLWD